MIGLIGAAAFVLGVVVGGFATAWALAVMFMRRHSRGSRD